MRLHFQERPWDLIFSVGYTVATAVVLLAADVGNLLATLLVFFFPGYVLVAALFPGVKEIGWIERIGFSLGLSIAVVPLLALTLNFTPWGIRFIPIVVSIALFTVLTAVVAYRRRMLLSSDQRLGATLILVWPSWRGYTIVDKCLTVGLAAGVVAAGVAIAYIIATPRPSEHFTEFYLLGQGGNASGYPTRLNVSEPGTVILGIANHESATVDYTIRVELLGVLLVYNPATGHNETVVVNRTVWSWLNHTQTDGNNWTQPYAFRILAAGLWKVEFLLFRDGDLSSVYRELHLFVRVT